MAGNGRTLVALFTAFLLLSLFPLPTSAQGIVGSISLECSEDPDINVKPGEYQDEVVECTVTNDGTLIAESIDITEEWDGVYVNMAISEDSFTIDA